MTEAAFRRLYRRHTPMLFAFAVRLCGCRTDAEELVQEAWVRAVERHDRYDGRSRYSTWLTGILINCSRESARRRARTPNATERQLEQAESAAVADFPPTATVRAEPIDIERALAVLPDGFREIVILHDVNGYTHKEIAGLLGISEGTSKSQLNRGRARMRQLLTRDTAPTRKDRGKS